MLDLNIDLKQIEEAKVFLKDIKNGTEKALQRSLSRTISMTKTRMLRNARNEYTVKSKVLHENLKVKRPSYRNLSGNIRSVGSPIPLKNFRLRERRYLGIEVKKNTPKYLKRAFLGSSGHVLTRVNESRYPVTVKFGPSAPQMLEGGDLNKLRNFAQKTLERRLDHEIINLLERGK